jgi:hypothetical protein
VSARGIEGEYGRRGDSEVASLATENISGGVIAIYEHVSVFGEIRAPFMASKHYATRGASSIVSPP